MYSGRAKQFLAFASLRGLDDIMRERERVIEPRRELSEDEAEELSRIMNSLKEGHKISVTHYDSDKYITTNAAVKAVDKTRRILFLENSAIAFDDITEIDRLDCGGFCE